ncbi:hypothetical protein [Autumnicola musiva]|uniref:Uncharacterized protein n=1 Tax=Autumnicola musiva TaxID=3075589 RepID=A0ABU3DAV4_9FLAO|nr:hypothetical protein [Zunongwangia sp. F117]MDT0678499.1 hypothetical protein [Zunongwangia sp. F117]
MKNLPEKTVGFHACYNAALTEENKEIGENKLPSLGYQFNENKTGEENY